MKRFFFYPLFITTLFIFSCSIATHRSRNYIPPRPVPTDAIKTHVLVAQLIYNEEDELIGHSHGCGSIINDNGQRVYVLTAGHVVETRRLLPDHAHHLNLAVRLSADGEWIPARVERRQEDLDAAIISFPSSPLRQFHMLPIAEEDPEIGDIIWGIGSPSYAFRMFIHRVIAGRCGRDIPCRCCTGNQVCWTLDGPAWPGFSGGAAVNRDGELVGIIVALHMFSPNRDPASGVIISLSTLRPLISDFLPNGQE